MTADTSSEAAEVAGRLLGAPVKGVEPVRGPGRNSRVFRVRCSRDTFALKHYPPGQGRSLDRLGTEAGALELMTGHGITAIPRLVASEPARGYLLFEWVEGELVAAATEGDIDTAIEFLAQVHALRVVEAARGQPLAAEACLSGAEIVAQVERRIAQLAAVGGEEPALARFLAEEARPLLGDVAGRAEAGYRENGLAFGRAIEDSARTLCPSDFGFHNALRRPDGRLVFIDFDYFGWDDPAKLVSDFLLHPGMSLPESLKRRFARAAIELYGADPAFPIRLRLLFPLFALRWCMILLNEFLPERWTVRVHAGAAPDWETAKRRQLDRAREWVQSLATNFRWFPYGE